MANAFVHVELNTNDVEKAKTFYSQLFKWQLDDVPMGPSGSYTMIKPEAGTGGGMLKHPDPKAPSMWLAYVEVEDVAAAAQKAKSLGGSIMKDATEVPGAGTMAIIIDPTGAMLALWKPKPR